MIIFENNKQVIKNVDDKVMACLPSLMLDTEIELVSQTYYAATKAILHFGEAELNFRTGERFSALGLSGNIVKYSNEQLTEWNDRGVKMLDRAIAAFDEFINTHEFSSKPISRGDFNDEQLRIKEALAQSHLKVSDVVKLNNAFEEMVVQAAESGELGVINYMRGKLDALKKVRLSPSRGTEENIPIWKLISAALLFGFLGYKFIRCKVRKRCCRTNFTENLIIGILTIALSLC